jgi:L-alanine-DL-glutamate epimerase-like enolase superfamily enzyme
VKLQSITTTIEKIPLKTPFVTALRRVENVEFVRVKVVCENAFTAFGEAPATKAVTGEDLESITNAIAEVKDRLLGLEVSEALHLLHTFRVGSSAKASLDMAFVTLNAAQKKQTLLEYLGTKDFTPIKTDITISLNAADVMLQDAKEALRNGYDILKVKLGEDITHAVEVTKKLSKELPNAVLLIDANQAWSLEDSLLYLEAVKELNIELIEQPVKAEDLQSLKIIANATDIPILADEAAFSLEDVQYIYKNKCADMINIKLMKCGGVSKAVEILEYAREKKIMCMLGSMLEGPISITAAFSLAFAYRDVIKYVDLDSPLLYKFSSSSLGGFAINRNQIKPSAPAISEAESIPTFA